MPIGVVSAPRCDVNMTSPRLFLVMRSLTSKSAHHALLLPYERPYLSMAIGLLFIADTIAITSCNDCIADSLAKPRRAMGTNAQNSTRVAEPSTR